MEWEMEGLDRGSKVKSDGQNLVIANIKFRQALPYLFLVVIP
jgi:hypothetical protein